MRIKKENYSVFSKNKTALIILFAFILFLIMNFFPKLGLDIYLLIRWLLILGVPIALLWELIIKKKTT